jgi:hypothetical protein
VSDALLARDLVRTLGTRRVLGRCDLDLSVGELSVGRRRRLAPALLVAGRAATSTCHEPPGVPAAGRRRAQPSPPFSGRCHVIGWGEPNSSARRLG